MSNTQNKKPDATETILTDEQVAELLDRKPNVLQKAGNFVKRNALKIGTGVGIAVLAIGATVINHSKKIDELESETEKLSLEVFGDQVLEIEAYSSEDDSDGSASN